MTKPDGSPTDPTSHEAKAAPEAGRTGFDYLMVSASSGVAIIATFASGVLLARLLDVGDRGIVALVIYWAGFAAAFGSLSLPDAFIYHNRGLGSDTRRNLPAMLIATAIMAFLAVWIAVGSVIGFAQRFAGISTDFAAAVIAIFVVVTFFNRALISVERAALNFNRLAIERVLLAVTYSGLLVAAGLTGNLSVELVLVVFLISRCPVFLARLWRYRASLIGRFDKSEVKSLFAIGGRFHGVALMKAVADQADKVVVSIQWTATNIAYFAVAYSAVGAAYSLVSQALGMISLPVASKLPADRICDHFAQSLRITTILLVAVMVPLAAMSPIIIPLIFGANYVDAVLVTQVLAVALLPAPLIAQADAVLRARGQTLAAFRMHAITVGVLAAGWLASGYDDIVSLGASLAIARLLALAITLSTLGGELQPLKFADCVFWRRSDFKLIWRTGTDLFARLLRRPAA